MEARERVRRRHRFVFPDDFRCRIERFKVKSGLSWRQLARRLGVTPFRLREWRRGVRPDAQNFMSLLTLAHSMDLVELLLNPVEGVISGCSAESELPGEPSPRSQSVGSAGR